MEWTKSSHVPQSDEFHKQKADVYVPLDPREGQFRILRLAPGLWGDPISATLETASFASCPDYEAISYVWGDLTDCLSIRLNGVVFRVTKSQYAILKLLRHRSSERALWIDATCIDQTNLSERIHQVRLMHRIYREATEVRIWLGNVCPTCELAHHDPAVRHAEDCVEKCKDSDLENALQLALVFSMPPYVEADNWPSSPFLYVSSPTEAVESTDDIDSETHLVSVPHSTKNSCPRLDRYLAQRPDDQRGYRTVVLEPLASLDLIFRQPWWRRIWTLQECVVPERWPTVLIGCHIISLEYLVQAARKITEMIQHNHQCRNCQGGLHQYRDHLDWQIALDLQRITAVYEDGKLGLMFLLDHVPDREASDPRDLVLALFGMINLPRYKLPIVDYRMSTGMIFARVTRWLLAKEKSLWRLEIASKSSVNNGPSWSIDFSCYRYRDYLHLDDRFKDLQKLRCTGNTRYIEQSQTGDDGRLIIKATQVAEVFEIGPQHSGRPAEDLISKLKNWAHTEIMMKPASNITSHAAEIEELSRDDSTDDLPQVSSENRYSTSSPRTRSTTTNSRESLQSIEAIWNCLFQECWHRKSVTVAFEDIYDWATASRPDHEAAPHRALAVERHISKVWGRDGFIMFSTKDGKIGSAGPNVKIGDEIFLAKGSPKPLVLRRLTSEDDKFSPETPLPRKRLRLDPSAKILGNEEVKLDHSPLQYMLVSTCYLSGIMHGEAVTKHTLWQDIILV